MMGRPVTLFTGQWADLPLEVVAAKARSFGYDGLELACWGDHLDVYTASTNMEYCQSRREILAKYGLKFWAISNHLVGQIVGDDPLDYRTDDWVPEDLPKDSKSKRRWAIETMMATARAAKNLGVKVVNGFVGSPNWRYVYSFPTVKPELIEVGFQELARLWRPILDLFQECDVKFALEVHPTEIAFDTASAARFLKALDNHPAFGFNYDPSHLGYQGVDYVKFIQTFADRIYHVHMKDVWWGHGDGTVGVFGGHTEFGDPRRYWDFRSLGHGDINFEAIIVALNDIGYEGPLSVEWEDMRMDREYGAQEACEFVRALDFAPSAQAFDAAFKER